MDEIFASSNPDGTGIGPYGGYSPNPDNPAPIDITTFSPPDSGGQSVPPAPDHSTWGNYSLDDFVRAASSVAGAKIAIDRAQTDLAIAKRLNSTSITRAGLALYDPMVLIGIAGLFVAIMGMKK